MNYYRKTISFFVSTFLVIMIICCHSISPLAANTKYWGTNEKPGINGQYGTNVIDTAWICPDNKFTTSYGGYVMPTIKGDKVTMSSSNKGVASIKLYSGKSDLVNSRKYWITMKKAGTTTLKCTVKRHGKTITSKRILYVVNYSNPFKSFKIGDKEYATVFDKWGNRSSGGDWDVPYKDYIEQKGQILITPNDKYEIYRIIKTNGSTHSRRIQNGSYIDPKQTNYISVILQDKKNKNIRPMVTIRVADYI